MDLPTIEWMEEMLRQHKGALLVVSHDRRFCAILAPAYLAHGANYAAVMVILMNLKAGQMGFWLMKR